MRPHRGMRRRWFLLGMSLSLVACATPQRPLDVDPVWRGRLSIQRPEPEPRQDTLQFELGGDTAKGWLTLQSPFGQSLAELTWSNQQVVWRQGERIQTLQSLEAWGQRWLGVQVTPHMLFALLQDPQATLPNWDLERRGAQQIRLIHQHAPKVQIRIWVEERPGHMPS